MVLRYTLVVCHELLWTVERHVFHDNLVKNRIVCVHCAVTVWIISGSFRFFCVALMGQEKSAFDDRCQYFSVKISAN